jgi:hypothetical protein
MKDLLQKIFYLSAVIVVNVVVLHQPEIVVAVVVVVVVVVVDLVHHIHVRLYLDGNFQLVLNYEYM